MYMLPFNKVCFAWNDVVFTSINYHQTFKFEYEYD